MTQQVECLCQGHKNCYFCLGTGIVHKSEQLKMIIKSLYESLSTSRTKLKITQFDFYKEPDSVLPNKVAYIITENTITKNPTQIIFFDHFHKNETVDSTLAKSISTLIKKTQSHGKNGIRKNMCFKIDFLINNRIIPFNGKRYSSSKYLELFDDIFYYFFSAYSY